MHTIRILTTSTLVDLLLLNEYDNVITYSEATEVVVDKSPILVYSMDQ